MAEESKNIRATVLDRLKPWGGSAAVHGVFLLVLLLWSIPIIQNGSLDLLAFVGENTEEFEEVAFSMADLSSEDVAAESIVESLALQEFTLDPLDDFLGTTDSEADKQSPIDVLVEDEKAEEHRSQVAGGAVSDANSVEAAVDKVTGGIRGELGKGDLLVVWLLDASLSLKDDRERVAERLEGFLREIATDAPSRENQLSNAVVSFGKKMSERVSPTRQVQRVLHSIRNAPSDRSGVENVFSAVTKCVSRYRGKWKSNLMIVVWTDESGDDSKLLEKTIERCKLAKVSVSVVGPSAVLGADTGLHVYSDPKTKRVYQLPVEKGPDSALPQKLDLRYWHPARPRQFDRGFGWHRMNVPSWLGGRYMKGLTSGFSPYALTRLAVATGGSYTIFDRPEDRGPFDVARLAAYSPDYGSLRNYRTQLGKHPLRSAIHEAVRTTHSAKTVPPPLALFDANQSGGTVVFPYLSPTQFRSRLRSSRERLKRLATRYEANVERALASVSAGGDPGNGGLDSEYQQETSLRWRAWYDLTRGRLLANSVRASEYRLTIDRLVAGPLVKGTNAVSFHSTSDMLTQDRHLIARMREAVELLERCEEENPNTPWAYLARYELSHGLGLRVQQMQLNPVEVGPQRAVRLPKF